MDATDILHELPISEWHGPFPAALQEQALQALESGRVLFLPGLPFRTDAQEAAFLHPDAAGAGRKNISRDPATGRVANTTLPPTDAARLAAMLDRFGRAAEQLIADLIPRYANTLERARTSFRPVEIEGRPTSPRHDDRLLHVDAFPSRPLHGNRILRLFSNVAPDGSARAWNVGEPFGDFAGRFLPGRNPAFPATAWLLDRLGVTKGRRSPYDHMMLRLHDTAKISTAYQASAPRASVSFPSGSTWLCFTDQVLHAALAGHCALEQTFHLPVAAMADPATSPLRVLERLSGRSLV
ncbi:MAG TPA: Kdo hydroxylase family protein [Acetobacteraceae bacterium]